jgi:hypothetical protein
VPEKRDAAGAKAKKAGRQSKKPYVRPTLTEYGSVSKLTMAKGSTQTETVPHDKRACL